MGIFQTMHEECVQFKNRDGLLLRGILHTGSDKIQTNATIIILNTGLNDMVGWHRIQVKISRFLAGHGYNVLRFDNFGIGDSEGELEEGLIIENFSRIEQGLWKYDAISAVDYVKSLFAENMIYYLGFCGGALTAIHAAILDDRVNGIINVAGPVTVSSKEYLDKKDPWTVKKNVESYRKKIVNINSMRNFFTGKSDYGVIYKSVLNFVRHKTLGRYNTNGQNDNDKVNINNLNTVLFDSFERYLKSKRPMLFYYAGLDNATWGFKNYFLPHFKSKRQWNDKRYIIKELENANHIFSGVESQELMKKDILEWLKSV